jgi:hypothetical protein
LAFHRSLEYTPDAMDFRNLHFLKSLNPIEFLDSPSKETKEFVAKIANSPVFQDYLITIRGKYNFPEDGMDLTRYTGQNFRDLPLENSEILKPTLYFLADILRERLHLASDFTEQIYLLLFHNSIIDVNYYEGFITDKLDYAVTKKQIIDKVLDSKYEVGAVIVPFSMSYETFKKQVKQIWKAFKNNMDEIVFENPYQLKLHKNTELAMEITRLKDKENMTFPQIADKLFAESDGINEKISKEEYIKKLYYEYQLIWELPFNQQKTQ